MQKNRFKQSTSLLSKFLSILTIALSFAFAPLTLAQEDTQAVRVLASTGSIDESGLAYKVTITGKIQNTLPLGIADVEITVIFPSNPDVDPERITLKQVAASSSDSFVINKSSFVRLSKYVAAVSQYRLVTEDVESLFEYFWNANDDSTLRRAAVLGLSALPPESLAEATERFQTAPLGTAQEDITTDLIEDLLLIPVLSQSKCSDTAESLLKAVSLYSEPAYEAVFSEMLTWVGENDTIIPLLNEAAQESKLLVDLLNDALYSMGDSALPALIKSTQNTTDNFQSDFAMGILHRLKRDSVENQLRVTDPDLRFAVIQAIGQNYNPEAILPLLSASSWSDHERQTVYEILENWGVQTIPQLIEGLNLPEAVGRQLAAEILIAQGDRALPHIQAALLELGVGEPLPNTVIEGVDFLVRFYEAERTAKLEQLYSAGVAQLAAGDCEKAVEIFEQLLAIEAQPNKGLDKIAEAFSCIGDNQVIIELLRKHLTIDPQDETVRLTMLNMLIKEADRLKKQVGIEHAEAFLIDAMTWYESSDLLNQLALLYIEQGVSSRQEKDWDSALNYLNKALTTSPDLHMVRVEVGKTIALKEWKLVIVSLIGTFLVGCVIQNTQKLTVKQKEAS